MNKIIDLWKVKFGEFLSETFAKSMTQSDLLLIFVEIICRQCYYFERNAFLRHSGGEMNYHLSVSSLLQTLWLL